MKSILIVEDNEAIIKGLKYLLEQEQFHVIACKNIEETMNIIGKQDIDLAVLDITLPDGSGYEMCEYIKKYNSLLPNGYNADLGGVEYHKHSDYIKQIISEKGMGNKNSKYVADVLMYDKQGNLLNRFQTAREAARYLGNESKNVGINYCLNGKQKTAYGYIWKYDKD